MSTVLLVIHLLVALALICVILLQRSAQDGGGLTGGGATMGGLFTARGSANLLSRTTAILATIFVVLSLVLGIMASQQHGQKSLLEQIEPKTTEQPAANGDADSIELDEGSSEAPEVPVSK